MLSNKVDLVKDREELDRLEQLARDEVGAEHVILCSARTGAGVDDVRNFCIEKCPLGPSLYPKDVLSEHPERFFIGELIREAIFLKYRKEIPYAAQVHVIDYKKRRGSAKDYCEAEIIVERNTQKGILIGHRGAALKKLGNAARSEIEEFVGKDVYLDLRVKVRDNWRAEDAALNDLGFTASPYA